MADDDTQLNLTQTTDVISFISQDIQDELALQGLEEVKKTRDIPFDPQEDARKLQSIIDFADRKIKQLSEISVKEFLEQENKLEAALKEDDTISEILIEKETPGLASILAGENSIAKIVKTYQKLMLETMKERRLLSGQLYGSRMQHNAQVGRMRSTRSIQLTGKNLLEELNRNATNLSPNEEMEMIGSMREHTKKLAAPVDTNNIINGHFTPVEDSADSVKEYDMLCSDWDED